MNHNSVGLAVHEVLAAVLQVRDGQLQVLLWQRAIEPDAGRWALPGGRLGVSEDVQASVLRQLAEKVDVREVAHVEQLGVFSAPDRMPQQRTVATAFLGLVPCVADRPTSARPAPGEAVLHQSRLRASRTRVHGFRVTGGVLGRTGTPGVSNKPATGTGPPRGVSPHRRHRYSRSFRWTASSAVSIRRTRHPRH
jgi:ADP-ribose pyrophosphatase YjhB (NUDIX family)